MASTWAINFLLVSLGVAVMVLAFGALARNWPGRRPAVAPADEPRTERVSGRERLKAGSIV